MGWIPRNPTVAFGINDFGEVVGNYVAEDDPARRHGFLRSSNGDFTPFDVPDAVLTIAEGINNDRTIVGVYTLEDGTMHGFVLKNLTPKGEGVFATVDVPDLEGNAQQTEINSINAKATTEDEADSLCGEGIASQPGNRRSREMGRNRGVS